MEERAIKVGKDASNDFLRLWKEEGTVKGMLEWINAHEIMESRREARRDNKYGREIEFPT